MNHGEMLAKLPEVLGRIEGRASGKARKNSLPEDAEVMAAFQQYALENAVLQGELWGKGFNSVGVGVGQAPGQSMPMTLDSDDEAAVIGHIRGILALELPDPRKVIPSRDIPAEDAGRTSHVEGSAMPRGDVTIPFPDNPRNLVEWLPLAIGAAKILGKLIAKWRNR